MSTTATRLEGMSPQIRNIVLEATDPQALASFYADLLDLQVLRRPSDWMVIGHEGRYPRLAFDPVSEGYQPPRWRDPANPPQVHLHISVPDRTATEAWLPERGATWLEEDSDGHLWADPAGHPFCLAEDRGHEPRITTIVFDCADPARLAAFYAELLDMRPLEPAGDGIGRDDSPTLRFAQVADYRPPRWPDPAYPQQAHLDLQVDDQQAVTEHALRLGATRLPDMGGDAPVMADPAGHPFCVCPVYTPKIKKMYDDAWSVWVDELRAIDPALTRAGGVCGDWTIHDVVGHVQAYARWRLVQLRGAFAHRAPTQQEIDGPRDPWPEAVPNTTEARNAAIRTAGLNLTWEQLLEEAEWIRQQTLSFLDTLDENLIDARVGFAPFWEPTFADDPRNIEGLMVRRLDEIPEAEQPLPVWRFVQPDEPDKHMTEHLDQIRGWLARQNAQ